MSDRRGRALPPGFAEALAGALPEGAIVDDPDELREHGRDWTRVHEPRPSLLAFPTTREDVQAILSRCNAARVSVVPSGGRTGLAGGAVAANGELVLSLSRMRAMDPVDELGMTVRVEAGAVTEAVHRHVAPHGLIWPVDFASKGSSTVGGNIATNAGGVKVVRYGLTREWVLGLEVVTASGEALDLGGALVKNNTGVDLRQLFIGSEGILGVVTAATLKLARLPGRQDVMLFALASLEGVLALFHEARNGPFVLSAYETFTDRCLARLRRHRKVSEPFAASAPFYALVEAEAHEPDALERWLAGVLERELVVDGVLAGSREQAAALWTLREGISESLAATGLPHKNDIALPIARLGAFVHELEALFAERYPAFEICLFGHIGDGNLHVNVMKPDDMDAAAFHARTHELDAHLMDLVRRHHGSVSAEHGIGLLKRDWIGHTRSEAELAIMRDIKRALDPNGILNPGKVL
jgi:FAD/FMN-containing dehydrogenase